MQNAAMVRLTEEDRQLSRLSALVAKAQSAGLGRFTEAELFELSRLFRFGASRVAAYQTGGRDPARLAELRELVARAHALLHSDLDRSRTRLIERAWTLFWVDVPRTIRAEWKILCASFLLLYGFAAVSYVAVRNDLELAYSLLDPTMVASEIEQLESTKQGEPFRGNFTFGVGASSQISGWIMTHNMSVGVLFFASGLVPPIYLWMLSTNGLMLGTYTAVAAHWGQAEEISSILWCHGVIELQAIVLAAAAALVLVRAWIAPGPWTRRHAMKLESARSWKLLAPVFPMLFVAGLIEGFVSPHAPTSARMAVAIASAVFLVMWIVLGGRERAHAAARSERLMRRRVDS
jgi:uncharacterized membrane protein SpoIIM required for sporulation